MCVIWTDRTWEVNEQELHAYKVVRPGRRSFYHPDQRSPQELDSKGNPKYGKSRRYPEGKLIVSSKPGFYLYSNLKAAMIAWRRLQCEGRGDYLLLDCVIPVGALVRSGHSIYGEPTINITRLVPGAAVRE